MHTLMILLALCLPASAMAATLSWDRNSEQDLKEYTIWACYGKDCQVEKTETTVQQPAVGVTPTATVEIAGKQGALAVTATDRTGNESALSLPLRFNRLPDPCMPDSSVSNRDLMLCIKALREQVRQ